MDGQMDEWMDGQTVYGSRSSEERSVRWRHGPLPPPEERLPGRLLIQDEGPPPGATMVQPRSNTLRLASVEDVLASTSVSRSGGGQVDKPHPPCPGESEQLCCGSLNLSIFGQHLLLHQDSVSDVLENQGQTLVAAAVVTGNLDGNTTHFLIG